MLILLQSIRRFEATILKEAAKKAGSWYIGANVPVSAWSLRLSPDVYADSCASAGQGNSPALLVRWHRLVL